MTGFNQRSVLQSFFRQGTGHIFLPTSRGTRTLADLSRRREEFEAKYATKLAERLKSEGVADLEEMKAKISVKNRHQDGVTSVAYKKLPSTTKVRKDSSPVKALTDFMDLKKIIETKQTAEQVSALWVAYHASRSRETGRDYLSATIPLASYLKMTSLATKYPSFVLPLPRPPAEPGASEPAHEFHFLQWGFHDIPPHPSQSFSFPLDNPVAGTAENAAPNPACSTVLLTPLQEYKLRQTFAQPHLVLTNYTDLVTTHGIVLLRGELTPSPSSSEKSLLSRVDAHMLAMGVQRFYLPTEEEISLHRVELLKRFHEKPTEFRWEELIGYADHS